MTDEERAERERTAKEDDILRMAGNAKDLLEKPLLIEVFTHLKLEYNGRMLAAESKDTEAIQENHRKYRAIVAVELELQAIVNSGKMVKAKREERDYQAAVVKEDEG